MTCVVITPNSPLIFRDPKPFETGAGGAVSMTFPTPSAVAGTLRTAIVRSANSDVFPPAMAETVVGWKFRGPLMRREREEKNGQVVVEYFVPAPADAYFAKGSYRRLRPMTEFAGAGFNLPGDLAPVGLRQEDFDAGKPDWDNAPKFWRLKDLAEIWLNSSVDSVPGDGIMGLKLERDRRTHVAIGDNFAAKPGMLFSTEAIDFQGAKSTAQLVVKIDSAGNLDEFHRYTHRIGGEGRFADFAVDAGAWPSAPENWATAVAGATKLRMVLVTPAVYAGGWRPSWIDATTFTGTIPGTDIVVKLVAARIPRWKPLAGWEIKRNRNNGRDEGGPKPLRRMTPAGSVYFFERANDEFDADTAKTKLWLTRSMADSDGSALEGLANLNNDGFGLAVWGAR